MYNYTPLKAPHNVMPYVNIKKDLIEKIPISKMKTGTWRDLIKSLNPLFMPPVIHYFRV